MFGGVAVHAVTSPCFCEHLPKIVNVLRREKILIMENLFLKPI
jgi:hypothetical protein